MTNVLFVLDDETQLNILQSSDQTDPIGQINKKIQPTEEQKFFTDRFSSSQVHADNKEQKLF